MITVYRSSSAAPSARSGQLVKELGLSILVIPHGMMEAMAQTRHGPIARVFIAANRLFGGGALLAGVALSSDFTVALLRGVPLEKSWWVGTFGVACIVGGVIYLRAPLTKD